MILDNLPDDLDTAKQEAIRRFRLLRMAIFKILPEDCLLRSRNVLTGKMVGLLDVDVVENGFVGDKDICALCLENRCIHFNVDDKASRILKIERLKDFGEMQ
ncbi:MAG: hypothetical protein A2998_00940 [Candidatus Staskawiczbacteria bacterium RIFCSPLOWO2_01_FULL_37_25b]|uniref:Uncharacterized protein n=1 Tax=Candidatus Staskawiczbacteria bacterium RIFCSPLOWO2_01_FULL_37_25b TaxID=1802213 RepID=A0A1G2IE21_9BACT|nr:MAG: hypothetical protein A2998_00940 [Candidatus Staskawiczbacteria bacterium RIFCSPLOWO2_01_FULL_37_25b]